MIYLSPPNITKDDSLAVQDSVSSGFVADAGTWYGGFEEELSRVVGGGNVLLTNTGSNAIKLALFDCCMIRGRGVVIVPAMTFMGAVYPCIELGLEIVVVGCGYDGNISVELLSKALNDNVGRVTAVMLASIYGKVVSRECIDVCNKHGVPVVNDAAESLEFGLYDDSVDYVALSFNGNKTITTGGGGALIVRDGDSFERLAKASRQSNDGGYRHSNMGFNMRMSNINAALGLSQLKRLHRIIYNRRKVNEVYNEAISGNKFGGVRMLHDSLLSTCWLPVMVFNGDVAEIQRHLEANGIDVRRLWFPVQNQEFVMKVGCHRYDGMEDDLYRTSLCLPTGCKNFESENIKRVVGVLNEFVQE